MINHQEVTLVIQEYFIILHNISHSLTIKLHFGFKKRYANIIHKMILNVNNILKFKINIKIKKYLTNEI